MRPHYRRVMFRGKIRTAAEVATMTGTNYRMLLHRLKIGWPIERAVSVPPTIKINSRSSRESMLECWRGADLNARLYARVEPNDKGCWIWLGSVAGQMGYGMFVYRGRKIYAHRASYELWHGKIPDGLCVLHRCDEPTCINPDHLWVGTKGDNMRDCISKGRWPRRKVA